VTREVREQHGWEYYYYGNVQGQGDARGWYTFDHKPRFNNNYLGLRNRIAILSEAYSYATFPDRILATSRFIEEILRFAHANASRVRSVVDEAAREPVVGQTLALRATFERSAEPVEILMGDVVEERNPFSGAIMLRRTDARRPERMYEYGTFQATEFETAPAAYVILDAPPPPSPTSTATASAGSGWAPPARSAARRSAWTRPPWPSASGRAAGNAPSTAAGRRPPCRPRPPPWSCPWTSRWPGSSSRCWSPAPTTAWSTGTSSTGPWTRVRGCPSSRLHRLPPGN
jgi:hypothetical protein